MEAQKIQILTIIKDNEKIEEACSKIVSEALEGPENFTASIIQFLIDSLGRNYDVTRDEATNPQPQLCLRIFESARNVRVQLDDLNVIKRSLIELFYLTRSTDLIHSGWYLNAMKFLAGILKHKQIRKNSTYKGVAGYLSAAFLIPLTNCYEYIMQKIGVTNRESILKNLFESIDLAMQNIEIGLVFEQFGEGIAQSFVEAIETFPDILIQRRNYLHIFESFFEYDNTNIIKMALTALSRLCSDESLKPQLIDFFYSDEYEMRNTLFELLDLGKSQSFLVELLCRIKCLNHTEEFFDDDMNEYVCKNLFSKSKKLIMETIEYMELHEWDILQTAIHVFSNHGDDIEKLNFLVDSIFTGNSKNALLKHSFKMVIDNKEEPIPLYIALRIYLTWSLNMMESSKIVPHLLLHLPTLLNEVSRSNGAIELLVACLIDLDTNIFIRYFNSDRTRLEHLLRALNRTYKTVDKFLPLEHLTAFMVKLKRSYQDVEDYLVRPLFEHYLDKFADMLEMYANTDELPVFGEPLVKLMNIMEHKEFASVPSKAQIKELILVLEKITADDSFDEKYADFPNILRMQTNVYKFVWLKFTEVDVEWLGNEKQMAADILRFIIKLFNLSVKEEPMDLYSALMIGSSFLELALYFQPNINLWYESTIFNYARYKFNKDKVKIFVKFLNKYIFEVEANSIHEQTCQKLLLREWVLFNRVYINLESKTASHRMIRFLEEKSIFKAGLRDLIIDLFRKDKDSFRQTVAFAILTFDEMIDKTQFKKFHTCFMMLLGELESGEAMLNTLYSITLHVLKRLTGFERKASASDINRLEALDYLKFMISGLNGNYKEAIILETPAISSAMTPQELQSAEEFLKEVEKLN